MEKEGKTLGDHIESLGKMTLPITGKPAVDKVITKVIYLGIVAGVGIYAVGSIIDVFSMTAAGVDAATNLIPTKGN